MRPRISGILAFCLVTAALPSAYGASQKVVIAEIFTGIS